MSTAPPPKTTAFAAGALAGMTVDLSLYPLDTLKTRLQSSSGFFASGGFRGIYKGIGSVLVGAAPGAAFFFVTYESTKSFLAARRADSLLPGAVPGVFPQGSPATDQMAAATLGEIAACAVRVPTEVVKQRAQAGQHASSLSALTAILSQRSSIGALGVWRELYRGWGITVVRELPFTVIQFPLWEALKERARQRQALPRGQDIGSRESATYGAVSGGVAAAITTPLDVLKTRVMLSAQRQSALEVVVGILRQHGIRPFFAGIAPRVMWISAGGAIFLGSYQWALNTLQHAAI